MGDPLSVLRNYNIAKKIVMEENDQIIFGELAWSKKVLTNFVKYGTSKTNKPIYYSLEAVLYLLRNVNMQHSAYVRMCAAEGITPVNRPDRKDLLEYVYGDIAACDSIDMNLPYEPPTRVQCESIKDEDADVPAIAPGNDGAAGVQQNGGGKPDVDSASNQNYAVKPLTDVIPVERLADLKAKHLANRQAITVKVIDKKSEEPKKIGPTELIMRGEFVYRDRNSAIRTIRRTFDKEVFNILEMMEAREKGLLPPRDSDIFKKPLVPPLKVKKETKKPYSRYEQENFSSAKNQTGGFQINTMGTYQKELQLAANKANVTREERPPSRIPIIIIPSLSTSLITMYNVKDLLLKMRYVSTDQKKREGCKRENEVLLERTKKDGTVAHYLVVDNTNKLTQEDWQRVVAVFVLGPTWQFKGWPWPSPVEMFSQICGFHVRFAELDFNANVKKWSVTVLNLSQTERYKDFSILKAFWEKVDSYLIRRRPDLKF